MLRIKKKREGIPSAHAPALQRPHWTEWKKLTGGGNRYFGVAEEEGGPKGDWEAGGVFGKKVLGLSAEKGEWEPKSRAWNKNKNSTKRGVSPRRSSVGKTCCPRAGGSFPPEGDQTVPERSNMKGQMSAETAKPVLWPRKKTKGGGGAI